MSINDGEPDEFVCKCGIVASSELALKKHQRKDCPVYRFVRIPPPPIKRPTRRHGQLTKECPYCHQQISNVWFAKHKRCCARWGSNLGIQSTPMSRRTHKRTK